MSKKEVTYFWCIEQLDHRSNPTKLYLRVRDAAWVGIQAANHFRDKDAAEAYQREFGLTKTSQVTCHGK